MFGQEFFIEYDNDTEYYVNLHDTVADIIGMTFKDALKVLFTDSSSGTPISPNKSFGMMKFHDIIYFIDSHYCGVNDAGGASGKTALLNARHFLNCIEYVNVLPDLETSNIRSI